MPAVDARDRISRFGAASVENGLAPGLLAVGCGAALVAANGAAGAICTSL